ncbi:MAG: hypothetical protein JWR15_1687 [Prosthecobacter sp.]|nr:hypothetical protein [Prosthecobacter sp.]
MRFEIQLRRNWATLRAAGVTRPLFCVCELWHSFKKLSFGKRAILNEDAMSCRFRVSPGVRMVMGWRRNRSSYVRIFEACGGRLACESGSCARSSLRNRTPYGGVLRSMRKGASETALRLRQASKTHDFFTRVPSSGGGDHFPPRSMRALRRSISRRSSVGTCDRLPPTRFFRGPVRSFDMGNILRSQAWMTRLEKWGFHCPARPTTFWSVIWDGRFNGCFFVQSELRCITLTPWPPILLLNTSPRCGA